MERDGKDLILTQEILSILFPDSTGRLRTIVNTSGEITEVSGSGISLASQMIARYQTQPLFGTPPSFGNLGVNQFKRVLMHDALTDAAGDYGPTAIVAALAGFQACMRIDYIYADGTDAAYTFMVNAPSGALGISPVVCASVANEIGPDFERGVYYQATVDNEALSLQLSNAGNAITYTFFGVYWYET